MNLQEVLGLSSSSSSYENIVLDINKLILIQIRLEMRILCNIPNKFYETMAQLNLIDNKFDNEIQTLLIFD